MQDLASLDYALEANRRKQLRSTRSEPNGHTRPQRNLFVSKQRREPIATAAAGAGDTHELANNEKAVSFPQEMRLQGIVVMHLQGIVVSLIDLVILIYMLVIISKLLEDDDKN